MILSKFITANRREAIAAPEIKAKATIRSSEAVFDTVVGERLVGSGYAVGIAAATGAATAAAATTATMRECGEMDCAFKHVAEFTSGPTSGLSRLLSSHGTHRA